MPQQTPPTSAYQIRTATLADATKMIAVILDAGLLFRDAQMAQVSDAALPAVKDIEAQIQTGNVWVAERDGHLVA